MKNQIQDVNCNVYQITKFRLRELTGPDTAGSSRSILLSQAKKALRGGPAVDCLYGAIRKGTDANKNFEIFTVVNRNKTLSIGCRRFEGNNRKILLKAIKGSK